MVFSKNNLYTKFSALEKWEKLLLLVLYNKSIFNAINWRSKIWKEKGNSLLWPKKKKWGRIMASEFLTSIERFYMPDFVLNHQLLQNPDWPLHKNPKPSRYCTKLFEYGEDNYWHGNKMTDQTVNLTTRIFLYAFPNCQALFAFDNDANHACITKNPLLAKKTKLMIFLDNHHNVLLRGKPKEPTQVPTERGLWRNQAPDRCAFLLECLTRHNRPSCDPSLNSDCCARAVVSKQPDFQRQLGWLQEEVETTGNLVIFYPKFHYELNFIKRYFSLFPLYTFSQPDWTHGRFWCTAKYYSRENCKYNLEGLRETVPKVLNSVTVSAIFHYYQHGMRIMDAYRSKLEYGTKQFTGLSSSRD